MAKAYAGHHRGAQNREPSLLMTDTNLVRRMLVHVLIIIAVGFLIYSNTFTAPFTFDDESYIVNNPSIRDFHYFVEPSRIRSATGIAANFRYALMTRPLGYLSFAVNYKLHGLNVVGYHVFNFLVHVLNALLVYALVLLTFRASHSLNPPGGKDPFENRHFSTIAFFSALLFVCHPIQTQAVTYVTQRFASLATLFYLFTLVVYVKSRLSESVTRTRVLYSAALISSILAMMVKEISFTLPAVIALYEVMFFDGQLKRRMSRLIPFFLTMLIIPLALLAVRGPMTDIGDIDKTIKIFAPLSRWDYLITEFRVIITYLRLLLFPVNQNLDYDYPIFHSFFTAPVFLSFIALLMILFLGGYLLLLSKSKGSGDGYVLRIVSFGIFWFFMTLSVESSVIPLSNVIFEHRMYLPSVGFFLSVVTSIFLISSRVRSSLSVADRMVRPLLVMVALILSVVAYSRNNVWGSEGRILEDVVMKSPAKARPHVNMGAFYESQGRLEDAAREFQTAIRLKPSSADAHNDLGLVYGKQGRFKEAMGEFQTAIKLMPDYAKAHDNLGVLYDKEGRFEDALREFRTVVKDEPDYAEGHDNLGVLYDRKGWFEDAIREFQIALKLKPNLAESHNNLGTLYGKRGRVKEAIREFQTAVRLRPDYAEAHNNLGISYEMLGLHKEAIASFKTAIAIDPNHSGARRNLELILKSKKQWRVP
jgi:tetratricopeptide (TPR) repeat protein